MESTILGIAFAFILGISISRIGLPPLVGFLIAGFTINASNVFGFTNIDTTVGIHLFADLGVTLLLFTIGLKLDIKSFAEAPFWGTSLIQTTLCILIFSPILMFLGLLNLPLFETLNWQGAILLSFGLSFSSTVFVLKILQDKGESQSLYGKLSIAVLIIQDLLAVVYLTISKGDLPSIWMLALLAIPLLRPIWFTLLKHAGHGEMLLLFGLCMALGVGYGLFSLVGLKGDLGALLVGLMLSSHKKAKELSMSLYSLKELFLVGFFLRIGLTHLPTKEIFLVATILLLILPIKAFIYIFSIRFFKLRIRTTLQASASLTNFSEFGLIVCLIAVNTGSLSTDWLTVMALTLALSFTISAPVNKNIGKWYLAIRSRLSWLQPRQLNKLDRPIALADSEFMVIGMGRIGTGTYEYLANNLGKVIGVDSDSNSVAHHKRQNRNIIHADATDPDFWHKVEISSSLKAIFLAMPEHSGNYYAASQLAESNFAGHVAVVVRYFDEEAEMKELGVNSVFNLYREAGKGLAQEGCKLFGLDSFQEQIKQPIQE